MKKSIILIIGLCISIVTFGQNSKEAAKAVNQQEKETRKNLNEKAGRIARKEGRLLAKEGYDVAPGALPLKKQLDNGYMKQSEQDEEGYPKWYISNNRGTANTVAAAKLTAMELAKLDLAGQLGSNILGLVENSLSNNQISEVEATSIQKVISASTNVISASLGRVLVLSEFYKKVGSSNISCAIMIGTNAKLAEQSAKKAIRKKLQEETDVVREKLDKMLGFTLDDDKEEAKK